MRRVILDMMTNNKRCHPVATGQVTQRPFVDSLHQRSHASLRDGWRSPLHCLQCRRFWCADFAQKHTDRTQWRWRLCCIHLPSLTLESPLTELHLSTVSVESCGRTAAWEPSGSGWHSSPEFCTGRRNKILLCNIFTHHYMYRGGF